MKVGRKRPRAMVAVVAAAAVLGGSAAAAEAGAPVADRETQEISLVGTFFPDTARQFAKGVYVSGDCAPSCLLHTSLRVGRFGARRLDTNPRLIRVDTIWEQGDSPQVLVRPGPAARAQLRRYSGPPLHVTLVVWGEHLGANGERVRSPVSKQKAVILASRTAVL